MNNKDTKPSAIISNFLKDSIIGMAAYEEAKLVNFPLQTSMFTALVVASHVVGSAYVIESEGGRLLPVPLYGISEQPSGTGKSILTHDLYSGYTEQAMIINQQNKPERDRIRRSIKEKMKADMDIPPYELEMLDKLSDIPIGTSDPTPEGLETDIVGSSGFFIAYSTEQGLSKTLFANIYGDGNNKKDDLMLKGFNGEYHKVVRANKDVQRFSGIPYGGVLELSQEGTIDRIMQSAGNTGTAERFIMLREDDLLGSRKYLDGVTDEDLKLIMAGLKKPTKKMIAERKKIKMSGMMQYKKQTAEMAKIRSSCTKKDLPNLRHLTISDEANIIILAAKQQMENTIGSQQAKNNFVSSMRSKIDLQVKKIAATLHCMDWDIATHGDIGDVIQPSTVIQAINIALELMRGIENIAKFNSLYGDDAEDLFVIEYLQSIKTAQTANKIKTNIKRRKETPFRFYTERGKANEKIDECLARLSKAGRIVENRISSPSVYKA